MEELTFKLSFDEAGDVSAKILKAVNKTIQKVEYNPITKKYTIEID